MPACADHDFTRAVASLVVAVSIGGALAAGTAVAAEPAAGAEANKPVTHATESVEACMSKWDPGTHMTKEAWRETCLRIKQEREPYVRDR